MPRLPFSGLFARRIRLAVALALLATVAVACNLGASAATDQITATPLGNTAVALSNVPELHIQSPADNSQALVNTEVDVYVQATDQVGVSRIEMRADDLLVDTSASPDPNGSPTLQSLLAWTPTTTGPHVLQIVAFRGTLQGNPQVLHITVVDNSAQITQPAVSPQFLTASPTIDPSCQLRANVDGLNVRTGPGINYDVLTTLAVGQQVPIIGGNSDQSWWEVNDGGAIGWVSAAYSSTSGVCSNIFVVPAPPSPTVPIGATPIFIPPTFTPIPALPTPVPTATIRVVVLPPLTFTPGLDPNLALTVTSVLATQTELARPTVPPPPGPTATPIIPTNTPIPLLPNLVVTSVSVGTPNGVVIFNPAAGVAIAPINVTVANLGTAPAPPFRVAVRQSDGTLSFAATGAPLPPNTQVTLTVTTYISQPGVALITAIADFDNVVQETTKTDNALNFTFKVIPATPAPNAPTATLTQTFTPPPPTPTNTPVPPTATPVPTGVLLPALVITGVEVAPDPVVIAAGQTSATVVTNVLITNAGNAPAAPFTVVITLPNNQVFSAQTSAPLPAGGQIGVPIKVAFTQAGTNSIIVVVDPQGVIPQLDRSHNTFTRDVLVISQGPPPPTLTNMPSATPNATFALPQLVIKSVELIATPLSASKPSNVTVKLFPLTVQVVVTIDNVGAGTANPFVVVVALPNGQSFSGQSTQPLPPGGETSVQISITLTQPGLLTLTVLVNPGNAIPVAGPNPTQTFIVNLSGPGNTPTSSLTPSLAPVKPSATPTVTNTSLPTATHTPTHTPAHTNTPLPVPPTATHTPTITVTAPPPNTLTATHTNTPTNTATHTPTLAPSQPTHTNTPTNTATHTPTLAPS
ncbi:MAG: CARDB domain-containing protein, partial [Aggregatilineales bacterium]